MLATIKVYRSYFLCEMKKDQSRCQITYLSLNPWAELQNIKTQKNRMRIILKLDNMEKHPRKRLYSPQDEILCMFNTVDSWTTQGLGELNPHTVKNTLKLLTSQKLN